MVLDTIRLSTKECLEATYLLNEGVFKMLYEKCREMLAVDISMEISELDTIRKVLSLADERCKKLSLLDVENLWHQYEDWHNAEIAVDKDWMKRIIKWISKDFVSTEEMRKIYSGIDKLFDTKE
jgi:sugar/nucleoside kinase (ribokinase family)